MQVGRSCPTHLGLDWIFDLKENLVSVLGLTSGEVEVKPNPNGVGQELSKPHPKYQGISTTWFILCW